MRNELDILKEYSQKSTLFLFPLLNVKANIKPLGTYFGIHGFNNGNNNLICMYYNKEKDYQNLKNSLQYLDEFEVYVTEGDYDIFVFNMSNIGDNYTKIINGSYSKIDQGLKIKITCKDTKSMAVKGLYPEQFYSDYAEWLEIPVEQITGNELLSSPDLSAETLTVAKSVLEELISEFAI